MGKILIVEDDQSMGAALRDGVEYEGHTAILIRDGDAAIRAAEELRPDVVILDVMLPKVGGLDVCRRLRQARNQVPIIFLTALSQEIDKVVGLRSGADDYVTKPFSFSELMARIDAVLRRTTGARDGMSAYEFADVRIDFQACEATKGGATLGLSAREFKLLEYFIAHRGAVVTRDDLLESVWGYQGSMPLTRTVDMHIAKLRQKIEDRPNAPQYIQTVHRVGYKFAG